MITIRLCESTEISDLQRLNNEVFVDNKKYDPDLDLNWALSEKGLKYFTELVNDKESLCLIVEDDGKRIGYLAAGPKHYDYRNSKYFEIQNMGVTPGYRSKGIGKQLMQKCFEWAKSKGYQKIFVSSYAKNTSALAFYKANGLDEIDIGLEVGI